jgi:radical SAM protein (TIGR01212 family)
MDRPYNSINGWLAEQFGERIFKVSLRSGLGCPNASSGGCIFCNEESYRPATEVDSCSPVRKEISIQLREGMDYIRKRHGASKFISYFQSGSNTYGDPEYLREIYFQATSHPDVVGLAISTRPDCIADEAIHIIRDVAREKLVWVELGLQSADDETLRFLNRGHSAAEFKGCATRLATEGIKVVAHVMIGLPSEAGDAVKRTAKFLNDVGVWGVKIHNLHVLKDTMLEKMYAAGDIAIPSLEVYASLVVDFLEVLNPDTIVHRVNSHSPRSLTVAPAWSINKLAIFNEVERQFRERNSYQGRLFNFVSS